MVSTTFFAVFLVGSVSCRCMDESCDIPAAGGNLLQLHVDSQQTSHADLAAVCGTCTACMWSNGICYYDASQSYCGMWPDNTWCGGGSVATTVKTTTKGAVPTTICGTCTACMWSNGICYNDASQSYCGMWPDNTWCGGGSVATTAKATTVKTTTKGAVPTTKAQSSATTAKTTTKSSLAVVTTPAPTGPKLLGGWCQAAWANQCTWGNSANIILPGAFQPSPADLPNPSNWAGHPWQKVWLVTGGEGVGTQGQWPCLDPAWLVSAVQRVGANGIDFDMEGCNFKQVSGGQLLTTITEMKKVLPNIDYVFSPFGDATPFQYSKMKNYFNYISPMFHYGTGTYNQVNCDTIIGWINNWLKAGWPPSKLLVSFQSYSATNTPSGPATLTCLAKYVQTKGLAGLIGWPSGSAQTDQANLAKISQTWR